MSRFIGQEPASTVRPTISGPTISPSGVRGPLHNRTNLALSRPDLTEPLFVRETKEGPGRDPLRSHPVRHDESEHHRHVGLGSSAANAIGGDATPHIYDGQPHVADNDGLGRMGERVAETPRGEQRSPEGSSGRSRRHGRIFPPGFTLDLNPTGLPLPSASPSQSSASLSSEPTASVPSETDRQYCISPKSASSRRSRPSRFHRFVRTPLYTIKEQKSRTTLKSNRSTSNGDGTGLSGSIGRSSRFRVPSRSSSKPTYSTQYASRAVELDTVGSLTFGATDYETVDGRTTQDPSAFTSDNSHSSGLISPRLPSFSPPDRLSTPPGVPSFESARLRRPTRNLPPERVVPQAAHLAVRESTLGRQHALRRFHLLPRPKSSAVMQGTSSSSTDLRGIRDRRGFYQTSTLPVSSREQRGLRAFDSMSSLPSLGASNINRDDSQRDARHPEASPGAYMSGGLSYTHPFYRAPNETSPLRQNWAPATTSRLRQNQAPLTASPLRHTQALPTISSSRHTHAPVTSFPSREAPATPQNSPSRQAPSPTSTSPSRHAQTPATASKSRQNPSVRDISFSRLRREVAHRQQRQRTSQDDDTSSIEYYELQDVPFVAFASGSGTSARQRAPQQRVNFAPGLDGNNSSATLNTIISSARSSLIIGQAVGHTSDIRPDLRYRVKPRCSGCSLKLKQQKSQSTKITPTIQYDHSRGQTQNKTSFRPSKDHIKCWKCKLTRYRACSCLV